MIRTKWADFIKKTLQYTSSSNNITITPDLDVVSDAIERDSTGKIINDIIPTPDNKFPPKAATNVIGKDLNIYGKLTIYGNFYVSEKTTMSVYSKGIIDICNSITDPSYPKQDSTEKSAFDMLNTLINFGTLRYTFCITGTLCIKFGSMLNIKNHNIIISKTGSVIIENGGEMRLDETSYLENRGSLTINGKIIITNSTVVNYGVIDNYGSLNFVQNSKIFNQSIMLNKDMGISTRSCLQLSDSELYNLNLIQNDGDIILKGTSSKIECSNRVEYKLKTTNAMSSLSSRSCPTFINNRSGKISLDDKNAIIINKSVFINHEESHTAIRSNVSYAPPRIIKDTTNNDISQGQILDLMIENNCVDQLALDMFANIFKTQQRKIDDLSALVQPDTMNSNMQTEIVSTQVPDMLLMQIVVTDHEIDKEEDILGQVNVDSLWQKSIKSNQVIRNKSLFEIFMEIVFGCPKNKIE